MMRLLRLMESVREKETPCPSLSGLVWSGRAQASAAEMIRYESFQAASLHRELRGLC